MTIWISNLHDFLLFFPLLIILINTLTVVWSLGPLVLLVVFVFVFVLERQALSFQDLH